jgi:hypothetical protein
MVRSMAVTRLCGTRVLLRGLVIAVSGWSPSQKLEHVPILMDDDFVQLNSVNGGPDEFAYLCSSRPGVRTRWLAPPCPPPGRSGVRRRCESRGSPSRSRSRRLGRSPAAEAVEQLGARCRPQASRRSRRVARAPRDASESEPTPREGLASGRDRTLRLLLDMRAEFGAPYNSDDVGNPELLRQVTRMAPEGEPMLTNTGDRVPSIRRGTTLRNLWALGKEVLKPCGQEVLRTPRHQRTGPLTDGCSRSEALVCFVEGPCDD